MACTCKPGTEATGWHEIRGADCVKAELAAWRRMMDDLPGLLVAAGAEG